MASGHELHHVDRFLPHLAEANPGLSELLPPGIVPVDGSIDADWVRSLSASARIAVCDLWLDAVVRQLMESQPLATRVLALARRLHGEFTAHDVVLILQPLSSQEAASITSAADYLVRRALLLQSNLSQAYCVPFFVRSALDRVELLGPREEDDLLEGIVNYFAAEAAQLPSVPTSPSAAGWRYGNLAGAWELAAQRRPVGSDSPRTERERRADRSLVTFGRMLGDALPRRQESLDGGLLHASLEAARRLGDADGLSSLAFQLGRHCHLQRRHEQALAAYRLALEVERELAISSRRVLLCCAIAIVLRETGSAVEANEFFLEAFDLAPALGDPPTKRSIANCAALTALAESQPRQALAWIERAGIPDQDAPQVGDAEAYLILAQASLLLDDRERGCTWLRAAHDRAPEERARRIRADAALLLSELQNHEDNADLATGYAEEAFAIYHALRLPLESAAACLQRSRGGRSQGVPKDALHWANRGLAQLHERQDPTLQAMLHAEVAECFWALDDPHRALAEWYLALDNLREGGVAERIAELYLRVAAAREELGEALEALIEALRAQGLARLLRISAIEEESTVTVDRLRSRIGIGSYEEAVETVVAEVDGGYLLGDARPSADRRRKS